jgi:hypothetical protein
VLLKCCLCSTHEREEQYTICEKCGADLLHCCDEPEVSHSSLPYHDRAINDDGAYPGLERRGAQAAPSNIATSALDVSCELVITCGVAARGWDFGARAFAIVQDFSDFTPDDEPYGEYDFGAFDPRRRQAVLEN